MALKMVLAGRTASAAARGRFLCEAEAAAALDHPHIVPIYELGEDDGTPYFSMKLIDGASLSGRAPRLAGDWRAVARLAATVARAVDHAHRRGVLHRDLKPSNILIAADREPHVTDFGLAVRAGTESRASGFGVVGTPAYMAPEQAAGESAVNARGDVYALGAVAFYALTGRPPFVGKSVGGLLAAHRSEPPPPVTDLRPDVPTDLAAVVARCLEKDPSDRFPSAADLGEAFARCSCPATGDDRQTPVAAKT